MVVVPTLRGFFFRVHAPVLSYLQKPATFPNYISVWRVSPISNSVLNTVNIEIKYIIFYN